MIIPTRFASWRPDPRAGILFIFALGTLAAFALLLLAVYLAAQLLNLVVETIIETGTNVSTLYVHADPVLQLIMLLLPIWFVTRSVSRFLRK